jgi:hypothetical protein
MVTVLKAIYMVEYGSMPYSRGIFRDIAAYLAERGW